MKPTIALGLTALAFAIATSGAGAAEDFYKGKTIRIVVGAAPVGGYENHSRIMSRYMGKHIPGNPTVIVQSMPGAGGVTATNHMFVNAQKDGTEIGLLNRNSLLSGLLGVEQAKYKLEEFNWLGTTASFSDNAHLFVMRSAVSHKSIEDLRGDKLPPISVGNSGSALIRALKEGLELNVKIIEGYQNTDLDAAFERGEIDGHSISYLTMMQRAAHWITTGYAKPMIQFGRPDRLPAIKEVPTARELARGSENLALILFTEAPLELGYPFTLPPGVPADRVQIIRTAFKATIEDPEYRAEVDKAKLELTPKYDKDAMAIIEQLNKAPASAKNRYKALVGDGG